MEITFHHDNGVTIIYMSGELNSDTSGIVYNQVVSQIDSAERVLLDMTDVRYMSSAGIRTLLLLYRAVINNGSQIVLVGLSEDLQDTLSLTGFLEFFNTSHTIDAGIRAIQ